MERKECSTGLQLIKVAAIKLKGNFSAVFMGAFAMTTPLILVLFLASLMTMLFGSGWILIVGVCLFTIFVGPLQMGYIKYFNDLLDGKQPRIREVYSFIGFSADMLRYIYIAGLLIVMYIIGGILWMVPAGFAISAFSMTFFFMQKYNHKRMTVAMKECATKMIGNRLTMFSYKLIFYFIYFLLFVICGLCFALIYTLAIDSLIISWIVSVCSAIVFIFLYTMVTVYFHSCNQIFFEDIISRDEKKRASKIKSEVNTTAQINATTEVIKGKEKEDKREGETKAKKSSSTNTKKKFTTKSTSKEKSQEKKTKAKSTSKSTSTKTSKTTK